MHVVGSGGNVPDRCAAVRALRDDSMNAGANQTSSGPGVGDSASEQAELSSVPVPRPLEQPKELLPSMHLDSAGSSHAGNARFLASTGSFINSFMVSSPHGGRPSTAGVGTSSFRRPLGATPTLARPATAGSSATATARGSPRFWRGGSVNSIGSLKELATDWRGLGERVDGLGGGGSLGAGPIGRGGGDNDDDDDDGRKEQKDKKYKDANALDESAGSVSARSSSVVSRLTSVASAHPPSGLVASVLSARQTEVRAGEPSSSEAITEHLRSLLKASEERAKAAETRAAAAEEASASDAEALEALRAELAIAWETADAAREEVCEALARLSELKSGRGGSDDDDDDGSGRRGKRGKGSRKKKSGEDTGGEQTESTSHARGVHGDGGDDDDENDANRNGLRGDYYDARGGPDRRRGRLRKAGGFHADNEDEGDAGNEAHKREHKVRGGRTDDDDNDNGDGGEGAEDGGVLDGSYGKPSLGAEPSTYDVAADVLRGNNVPSRVALATLRQEVETLRSRAQASMEERDAAIKATEAAKAEARRARTRAAEAEKAAKEAAAVADAAREGQASAERTASETAAVAAVSEERSRDQESRARRADAEAKRTRRAADKAASMAAEARAKASQLAAQHRTDEAEAARQQRNVEALVERLVSAKRHADRMAMQTAAALAARRHAEKARNKERDEVSRLRAEAEALERSMIAERKVAAKREAWMRELRREADRLRIARQQADSREAAGVDAVEATKALLSAAERETDALRALANGRDVALRRAVAALEAAGRRQAAILRREAATREAAAAAEAREAALESRLLAADGARAAASAALASATRELSTLRRKVFVLSGSLDDAEREATAVGRQADAATSEIARLKDALGRAEARTLGAGGSVPLASLEAALAKEEDAERRAFEASAGQRAAEAAAASADVARRRAEADVVRLRRERDAAMSREREISDRLEAIKIEHEASKESALRERDMAARAATALEQAERRAAAALAKAKIKEIESRELAKCRRDLLRSGQELLQAREEARALRDALETPGNLHRWRFLGGADPNAVEAIERAAEVRRKLVERDSEVTSLKEELSKLQATLQVTETRLSRAIAASAAQGRLGQAANALRKRDRALAAAKAELYLAGGGGARHGERVRWEAARKSKNEGKVLSELEKWTEKLAKAEKAQGVANGERAKPVGEAKEDTVDGAVEASKRGMESAGLLLDGPPPRTEGAAVENGVVPPILMLPVEGPSSAALSLAPSRDAAPFETAARSLRSGRLSQRTSRAASGPGSRLVSRSRSKASLVVGTAGNAMNTDAVRAGSTSTPLELEIRRSLVELQKVTVSGGSRGRVRQEEADGNEEEEVDVEDASRSAEDEARLAAALMQGMPRGHSEEDERTERERKIDEDPRGGGFVLAGVSGGGEGEDGQNVQHDAPERGERRNNTMEQRATLRESDVEAAEDATARPLHAGGRGDHPDPANAEESPQ